MKIRSFNTKRYSYFKPIISLLLVVLMIVPMTVSLAVPVSAETVKYPVDGGYIYFNPATGTVTGCTGKVNNLDIPSSINGVSVTAIGNYAFYDKYVIKTATIPDTVTKIGDGAFEHCEEMTSITIPDSVTSIGTSAFHACPLTSIHIPNGLTRIEDSVFSCTGITSFDIPESVTSIGSYAFDMTCITSITIPDSVTSIGKSAFYKCNYLKTVVLSNNITTISESMFAWCPELRYITIPNSVTSIAKNAFYKCDALRSINIPDSVISIGENAFSFCKFLTSVNISDSVTSIDTSSFAYCDSLASINIDDNNPNYSDIDGVLFNKEKTELIRCPAGKSGSYTVPLCVTSIAQYSFEGCDLLTSVDIPDGVTSIDKYAFSSCGSLSSVIIPDSVTSIGTRAFNSCKSLEIWFKGSEEEWGKINKTDTSIPGDTPIKYNYPCSVNGHTWGDEWITDIESTCTEKGTMHRNCIYCEESETEDIPVISHAWGEWITITPATCGTVGARMHICPTCKAAEYDEIPADNAHDWGEWVETTAPTTEAEGVEARTCEVCGTTETKSIPKIEFTVTVENYTVTMNNASSINHIRYVPGVYTTSADIRNAEGVINVNATAIGNLAVNDVISFDVKYGGTYSFWIRFTDGSTVIKHLDFTKMTQTISTEGLMLTVHNLYGVKDYFVGKGTYNTYRELKNGENVGRVTSANIAGEKNFTSVLPGNGEYTVCVRYEDTNRPDLMLYFSVEVDMPEVEVNGLQVNMSGLTDVRVIRTAPGEWATPGQVKRAEGARNIKGSSLKGSDTLTLQYSEDGVYTITLEYYNGLTVVKTFEIKQKTPTVEQNGSTVVIGDLDDLYVIRYAKGEYTYAGDIKRAEGSKFIRPSAIDENGNITVELDEGLYTFCVQYNDMSYNYYTIVVE